MKNISQHVYEILRDKIINGDYAPGMRITAIRKLSKLLGASSFAIMQAFKKLEKDELIERFVGSGVYVKDKNFKNKSIQIDPANLKKPEKIAEQLASDILAGKLRIGTQLPIKKVFRFQFKTSYKTMHDALLILEKKGLIFRRGSAFWVGSKFGIHPSQNTIQIYLIGRQPAIQNQFADRPIREFFQNFEMELQRYGHMNTDFIKLDEDPLLLSKINKQPVTGFFLNTNYLGADDGKEVIRKLKTILSLFEKQPFPLLIFDWHKILYNFSEVSFSLSKNIYPLYTSWTKAGEIIGQYLALLGHKNIAFITTNLGNQNQSVYTGITNSINQIYGNSSKVHLFCGMDAPDSSSYIYDFSKKAPDLLRKVFGKYTFKEFDPVKEAELSLRYLVSKDCMKHIMKPYLEKALNTKGITAWFASGRELSIVASEFLKYKKISVPDELSFMGLSAADERTMAHGITAYDGGWNTAGYLGAHCILEDIQIKKNRYGCVEYDGRIIERGSAKAI